MKYPGLIRLGERLLYGPDKPDVKLEFINNHEQHRTNSAATSPTLAHDSPTEWKPKALYNSNESTATSPTLCDNQHVARASPLHLNGNSMSTSPTSTGPESASPTSASSTSTSPTSPTSTSAAGTSPTVSGSVREQAQRWHPSFNEQSVASTLSDAGSSPEGLYANPAKIQLSVNETALSSPTLTDATPPSANDWRLPHPNDPADSHALTNHTGQCQRPLFPAVQFLKSLWTRPPAAWQPTVLQIRPLIGILALCVTVACAFASLSVLIVSDGQAQTDWPVSPAVVLAIITAVANSAIGIAYLEAVPISFWHSMMRGRTIRSLERQWQVSRSMVYAIAKIRHLSVLNIACIAAALVVIDGPLLQRASAVVRATQATNIQIELKMLPELPSAFSGITSNHIIATNPEAGTLFPRYTSEEPMQLNVGGCNGTCSATIQGPGVLKTDCSTREWPITPAMLHSMDATWGEWSSQEPLFGAPTNALPSFEVSVTPLYTLSSSAALMRIGLASWHNLTGRYTMTECNLLPTIALYDVVIEAGVVTIPKTPGQGRLLQLANNTRPVDPSVEAMPVLQESAIDVVTIDTGLVVNSNVSCAISEGPAGPAPDTIYAANPYTYNQFSSRHFDDSSYRMKILDFSWADPTDNVVFTMNELMFRAGVYSTYSKDDVIRGSTLDPGVSANQTVNARQEITQNVYESDLRWYAGATVVQIVTALLVLPMFWGWWNLGCNLTLSPFTIALAFDSPVVGDINSAAGSVGVVERLGGLKLKYGAVASYDENDGRTTRFNGRLGVAEHTQVSHPLAGSTFTR